MSGLSYPVLIAALTTRLQARPALTNVNVLDHGPVNRDDLRTDTGVFESIYPAGVAAEGTLNNVVFCGPQDLRFDETYQANIVIEVVGTDSADTQTVVRDRVNELLLEVLADIEDQSNWDFTALGLDTFDYLWFTPAAQAWSQGRIEGQPTMFAAGCELGIQVRARRSF